MTTLETRWCGFTSIKHEWIYRLNISIQECKFY